MNYLAGVIIAAILAFAFGLLICSNSIIFMDLPLIIVIIIINYLIQIIAFIPAKIYNTEKYYDLVGSLTFTFSTLFALSVRKQLGVKQIISAGLVLGWTIRLGGFLFYRFLTSDNTQGPFVAIKRNTMNFFFAWFIQGFWVTITGSPVFLLLSKNSNAALDLNMRQILGLSIWFIGNLIQITADFQKYTFRSNPDNKDKFITTGLWKYSQHPNYCGQVILWAGTSLFVSTSLQGLELVTLVSPIFVYLLLTKLSGVPILSRKAYKKWGSNPDYIHYIRETPVMFFGKDRSKQLKKN